MIEILSRAPDIFDIFHMCEIVKLPIISFLQIFIDGIIFEFIFLLLIKSQKKFFEQIDTLRCYYYNWMMGKKFMRNFSIYIWNFIFLRLFFVCLILCLWLNICWDHFSYFNWFFSFLIILMRIIFMYLLIALF
jgi:hypothetical protein